VRTWHRVTHPPLVREQTTKKGIWNVETIRNIIVNPIITKRLVFWRTPDGATCIYGADETGETGFPPAGAVWRTSLASTVLPVKLGREEAT